MRQLCTLSEKSTITMILQLRQTQLLPHTRTVVRECFKGDEASQ